MRKFVACVAAIASLSAPAFAQNKCWTSKEMAAARVRDLQSVLMVGALQCRTSGHDVLAEFNKFVVAGRSTIVAQNDVLKARFVRLMGMKAGQAAYDSFTTALANAHAGSSSQAPGFCEMAQAMAREATNAAGSSQSTDALELIAERLGERPSGVGEGCADSARPAVTASAASPRETLASAATTTTTVTRTNTTSSVFTLGQPAGH